MSIRIVPLCLGLVVGCQALSATRTLESGDRPVSAEEAAEAPAQDDLQRAAAYIESGDQAGAVPHMLRHIEAHPDQVMIRAYLAELLLRLNRLPEAQRHFERFIAESQEVEGPARKHLVHCHTRLMEIAQDRGDAYGEHLHRGIGLYLLAQQQSTLSDADNPAALTQQLLCRAATELNEARKERPDEARPSWYLFGVWSGLDQPRPAERALREAREAAPFSTLTPAERRALAAVHSSKALGITR